MKRSHYRSLIKACTWRVTASLDTFILVWIITGSFEFGATIGILEIFTKIFIYYIHERCWYKIDIVWRKVKNGG